MAVKSLARSGQETTTREQRGLALYRDHAVEIRYEDGAWFVPSGNEATSIYEVTLGRHESCECRDHGYRNTVCKHIIAATIARAKSAPCAMCGDRFKHRELTEVPEDHLTCFEGDLLCPECARDHGVS